MEPPKNRNEKNGDIMREAKVEDKPVDCRSPGGGQRGFYLDIFDVKSV